MGLIHAYNKINVFDGILRCSRYAFGPNRLHYCGPDANSEIFGYINENMSDPGLEKLMQGFKTMYPYLKFIAKENGIEDVFDERVVEAYWLGNELLENTDKKDFWRHLLEDHQIKKKVGAKSFSHITDKLSLGAVPHHSFHVLDIWKRTGFVEREHTLESMDSCRISWGKVSKVSGPTITVEIEPLTYHDGKLHLSAPISQKFIRNLESDAEIEKLKPGDIVSTHWGVICEVITAKQAAFLKKYTLKHIALANLTI